MSMRTPPPAVPVLVEDLFRREAGRLVAALVRLFGPARLELAEDVVQETLVKALEIWPHRGVPEHPAAWLRAVARHRALDSLRRDAVFRGKEESIESFLTGAAPSLAESSEAAPPVFLEGEIRDDQLRMIFTCCHPALSEESQVALTLKTLGGFGVPEIARALLADEAAVAQRLVRAKRTLREGGFPFVVPEPAELTGRLDAVLSVIYLLFNEGYNACDGPDLTRPDLCREAIYLAGLVREHPVGSAPRVDALLALFCLQAARLPARVDGNGDLCLLADQDRSRWDRRLIDRGLDHLAAAARGGELSPYHLEAGVAACHAAAASDAETDWRAVLASYDALVAMTGSAVAGLNRAVAVARVHGPAAGLAALEAVVEAPALRSYYLLPATRAALEAELGNWRAASESYARALTLTRLDPERRFLERKLREIAGHIAGDAGDAGDAGEIAGR